MLFNKLNFTGDNNILTTQVLACLEVENKLGVVGRSTRNKANMDPLDGEMLDLFEK